MDRSALIISGEFSSGLASDTLGDISPSETSSALNLFCISMGLLFLPTLVHPLGIRQDMRLFLEVRSYVISKINYFIGYFVGSDQ